LDTVEL